MNKITIAYDGSSHSLASIKEVKKLKIGFPTVKIVVLHVTDVSDLKDEALAFSDDGDTRKYHRQQKIKDELSGLINADEYSITLLYGDPATEILSYMKANPTDMLVMGNRGLNAIQELVMGSVSHKVVQHSTVPVLIVK